MKLFDWLRGKKKFNDAAMADTAKSISDMLLVQLTVAGGRTPDTSTPHGVKALGYIYGFVDAALRALGQDMSDVSIGVPVLYHVLRNIFPNSEDEYLKFISDSLRNNENMMAGIMQGGQQYINWLNGKVKVPMGLTRYLIGHDPK